MESQPFQAPQPGGTWKRWMVSYTTKSTSIIYGLPPIEQQVILGQHRRQYLDVTGAATHIAYDFSCQWYKNLHAIGNAAGDSNSDEGDSIFSDTMPPLEPTSTSDESAPPTPTPAEPEASEPLLVEPATARQEMLRYWTRIGMASHFDDEAPDNCGPSDPDATAMDLGRLGGFIPAPALMRPLPPGILGGERVETSWAEAQSQMGAGMRSDLDGEEIRGHELRIISVAGISDITCYCADDKHSVFTQKVSYAFLDTDGNVVPKRCARPDDRYPLFGFSVNLLRVDLLLSHGLTLRGGWPGRPLCACTPFHHYDKIAFRSRSRRAGASHHLSSLPPSSSPPRSSSPSPHSSSLAYPPPSSSPVRQPSYRAPNRSQHVDSSIEYERKAGDRTFDKSFHISGDGRRAVRKEINVGPKKRKIRPADLVDPFADWMPLRDDDGERGEDGDVGDEGDAGDKRKRYESSDQTMNPWRKLVQLFLDEMVRREGLGTDQRCPCCEKDYVRTSRRFRCDACGQFTQCLECVVSRHRCTPLHKIKEWNGTYWVKTTVLNLGCVFQLGHGGHACPRPAPTKRKMVVMDVSGIYTVEYRWCGCDNSDHANELEQLLRNGWYPATTVDPSTCATFAALELFRLLNVVGNVNVHDFVGVLERETDASKVTKVPDRYKSFGRMSRQWAFLKRLLHAGRAHDPLLVKGTKNGACATLCWACPHDNINIPEGWRDVAPEFRFLYMLFLAVDANFRLKNRLRANEHQDLPLGSGWGYMVEGAPYKKHLVGYVAEKDLLSSSRAHHLSPPPQLKFFATTQVLVHA
ncbi:hypothetical protein C8F04DRAFT_1173231 [Mycena alexandri]|uniref:CxC2-like cysteine cluster KDZ transposase-associated domain-containing protein n=1 Tax=Mycena alexandri TaxID=1745969 RepID=A0AAD6TM10_9AGAR|nr:hypothetical protein C8F04DRAFT_1173231 [Mycena alexandri]